MTNLEAIEELKHDCNELGKAIPCDTGWGVAIDSAYDMAVMALEKQIPKKPNIGNDNGRQRKCCPACGCFYNPASKYCPKCGQALDLED